MTEFNLTSEFSPRGSQPEAIRKLVNGVTDGLHCQTLLGVTGSGKTFTMANVIQQAQRPALVIAHNKTLAAQLYNEFREFFPDNRVEYFVSYYDYYQPESYIPQKDQYIEKDAQINPKIEQMRLSATASLLSRRDVIVVASVSCIYGLGRPEHFRNMGFELKEGDRFSRKDILERLVSSQYERNDLELMPGRFRVRGDTIDIIPGYFNDIIRIELFGDRIERILEVEKATGKVTERMNYFYVFPARHYVIPVEVQKQAIVSIREELEERLPHLGMMEAHRLEQRTRYDLEMIEETGSARGSRIIHAISISGNPGRSRYLSSGLFPLGFPDVHRREPPDHPPASRDVPGDRSRKNALVDYGFRLPSAYDNRPLKFDEFEGYMRQVVFVSATPGEYRLKCSGQVVEQIIRPTGLVDPEVEVRKTEGQTEDVIREIRRTVARGDRVLLTTLTKKLAEELTEYLAGQGIRTRYLHSEIDTLERTEIIRELRLGNFDVLVGINLLREGLDIPEVGFIGILDADKEGFLRDARSLIQIIGRAARNVNSLVVLYADNITGSIRDALSETKRRRECS